MDLSLRPGIIRCGFTELRPFVPALSATLWELRNHPEIRQGMRNTTPIDWAAHQRFVAGNLGDPPTQYLFLVHHRYQPLGLTLLRPDGATDVEIGVMVRGSGERHLLAYRASHMIGWFAFEKLGLPRLISKVPVANTDALRFNLHCGFRPIREPDSVYHYLALTQQASRELPGHRRFRRRWRIEMHPVGAD